MLLRIHHTFFCRFHAVCIQIWCHISVQAWSTLFNLLPFWIVLKQIFLGNWKKNCDKPITKNVKIKSKIKKFHKNYYTFFSQKIPLFIERPAYICVCVCVCVCVLRSHRSLSWSWERNWHSLNAVESVETIMIYIRSVTEIEHSLSINIGNCIKAMLICTKRRVYLLSIGYRLERNLMNPIKPNGIPFKQWLCQYYSVDAPHWRWRKTEKKIGGNCPRMLHPTKQQQ